MNYKAKRNLTIGEGGQHKHVKAGDVFSCSPEYAEEHLHPHDHVEETSEPVSSKAKMEAKKAKAEASKAEVKDEKASKK